MSAVRQSSSRLTARRAANLSALSLCLILALGAGSLAAQQATVSPALPTTQDAILLEASFLCNPIDPPVFSGRTITLDVPGPLRPCAAGFVLPFSFPLPPLAAGSYTVRWTVAGSPIDATTVFQVAPVSTSLDLLGGRFQVVTTFTHPGGPLVTRAYAATLSDESGYFWFFSSPNVEITTKILDGQIVNGNFWVFIGSMTDVAFTVEVTDLQNPAGCSLPGSLVACTSHSYRATAGHNQSFIDTQSFVHH